ncbi:hypothetical protein [Caballeronia glebae]|jgi:hypothetical protein
MLVNTMRKRSCTRRFGIAVEQLRAEHIFQSLDAFLYRRLRHEQLLCGTRQRGFLDHRHERFQFLDHYSIPSFKAV